VKTVALYALALFMTLAGVNHFLSPGPYIAMVPVELPNPTLLVQLSGVAEILGGLGLLHPRTRRLAAWGLIALFVAVFPANLNMALNHLPLGGKPVPTWALWARLPLQAVLIAWAFWFTRPDRQKL
jgi:uncharacterized membrane protein